MGMPHAPPGCFGFWGLCCCVCGGGQYQVHDQIQLAHNHVLGLAHSVVLQVPEKLAKIRERDSHWMGWDGPPIDFEEHRSVEEGEAQLTGEDGQPTTPRHVQGPAEQGLMWG